MHRAILSKSSDAILPHYTRLRRHPNSSVGFNLITWFATNAVSVEKFAVITDSAIFLSWVGFEWRNWQLKILSRLESSWMAFGFHVMVCTLSLLQSASWVDSTVEWRSSQSGLKPVAVLGWGQGAQAPPQILPRPPKFLIGSVVHCFY